MRPTTIFRHGILAHRAAGATAVAMSMLVLTACELDATGRDTDRDVEDLENEFLITGEPADGTEASRFIDDLDSYENQVVTVSADITEVISPHSFVIGGPDETTLDPVLVVSAAEVVLDPDLEVQVTGVVRPGFDLAAAEAELGLDLTDELYRDWDGEAFILATDVEVSDAQ